MKENLSFSNLKNKQSKCVIEDFNDIKSNFSAWQNVGFITKDKQANEKSGFGVTAAYTKN